MYKEEVQYMNIIKLEERRKTISFVEISEILDKNPTYAIYFTYQGDFYGYICGSDILGANKSHKEMVVIRKGGKTIEPGAYMDALKAFFDEPNLKVIPIIDKCGQICGEYQRWDDFTYLNYAHDLLRSDSVREFFKRRGNLAMLVPSSGDVVRKNEYFRKYKSLLESLGCTITPIKKEQLNEYFSKVDYVIVVDENEGWGVGAHYEAVNRIRYNWNKAMTLRRIEDRVNTFDALSCMEDVLVKLAGKGVAVVSVFCKDNGNEYFKRINNEISARYKEAGIPRADVLLPQWYKDYFDDLYDEEYVQKILNIGFPIIKTSGIHKLIDCKSDVYNVVEGERITIGQPENYSRRILFFGRCFATGFRVDDEHTVESILQRRLNDEKYEIQVRNLGCWDSMYGVLNKIVATDIHEGDIVVVQTEGITNNSILSINLTDVFEKTNLPSKWMVDSLEHVNHNGYKLLADGIFEELKEELESGTSMKELSVSGISDPIIDRYINRYFSDNTMFRNKRVGSIVMNCNPFTYGHRFLIEEAGKQVDYLIIFVVQEDQSAFSFDMRMACVKAGVADLDNIFVVPSGDFIISQKTFPEYFLKVDDEDLTSNMEYDITIFAEKIAPRLNIKYRFVGEELSDAVTRQYNETMKSLLPKYDIEYVEIPRKTCNDEVISASRVRELMQNMDGIDEIAKLIPESTLSILNY